MNDRQPRGEKGNALVRETSPLLKQCDDINFTGSIEAREIPAGACDVVVCEAFVGNVILKLYEGVGSVMIKKIKESLKSDVKTAVGGMLIKPALKKTLKSFDASQYGGAPLRTEGASCQDARKCEGRRGGQHPYTSGVQFQQQRISERFEMASTTKNQSKERFLLWNLKNCRVLLLKY